MYDSGLRDPAVLERPMHVGPYSDTTVDGERELAVGASVTNEHRESIAHPGSRARPVSRKRPDPGC
jgi:hypothetical protein